MRNIWKAAGATLALLVSVTAEAQGYPQPPPRGYREPYGFQHNGLYLHFDTGPGFMSSTFSSPGNPRETISGPAWTLAASLGGAIAPNLILAADLFGAAAFNPSQSYGDSSFDTQLDLVGFGPELVYYFTPINMYLSGTLAFTYLSETVGFESANIGQLGLGGRIAIVKEWWLGPRMGLGIGGQVFFSTNQEPADVGPDRISTFGAGMLLSLTLN